MRLFFGISLPDSIRHAVSDRAAACHANIPGRYTAKSNYHITLAFLGNVSEDRAADASDVLLRCISNMQAPRLTLGETGFFGRAQNAILIAHVLCDPSLDPLHDALIRELDAAHLPFDSGPFSPHITLARHARLENAALPDGERLSFVPDCAHLYLSARNDLDVLTYTPISSVPFSRKRSVSGNIF